MSGINNISGSPTTPIQHSPSQASGPARLVIRTADQARDHWRAITSLSQASDAMAELEGRSDEGHIDEETYRLLANTLRNIHNTLQERETTQAQTAHLPVRPPAPGWQAPTRVSAETLARAETAIEQGASVEHAAQQHGISDFMDMIRLRATFNRQQTPPVSAETLAVAVTAIEHGASVAHAAQQHGISDIMDMNSLRAAFNRQQTPPVSAETLARAETAIEQGASVAHAAQQHGISDFTDMNSLHVAFTRQQNPPVSAETLARAETAIQQGASVEQAAQQHGISDFMDMIRLRATFNSRR